MKKRISLILILMCMSLGSCQGQHSAPESQKRGGVENTITAVPPVLQLEPVLVTLDHFHVSGSLEYSATCHSLSYPGFPEFPPVQELSRHESSPVLSIREMFSRDSIMHVIESPEGSIRMTENNVPQDILNIRIQRLSFESIGGGGIYNANTAVNIILASPEVSSFMKNHSIALPFTGNAASGMIGDNLKGLPNVSGEMRNITVKEALDRILKVFPGIWIYQNCPRSDNRNRIVYFAFYQK